MTVRIGFVCEAAADFGTGSRLLDRVIEAHRPAFYEGYSLDDIRVYCGLELGPPFLLWSRINGLARDRRARQVRGSFAGKFPAHPVTLEVIRALRLFQFHADPTPDAVVFLRDSDNNADRRNGLRDAHEAVSGHQVPVVVGVAHTERECWLIAGFEPKDGTEQLRLDDLVRQLTFDPRTQSERLAAPNEADQRHPKRVLRLLTNDDRSRAVRCLETPLATLEERGQRNGLTHFITEARSRLIHALLGGAPPQA